jgi:hypothetical protein
MSPVSEPPVEATAAGDVSADARVRNCVDTTLPVRTRSTIAWASAIAPVAALNSDLPATSGNATPSAFT